MATACVTAITDGPGRIMAGIAALGLILFASGSWRARPRLSVTGDGLTVRGWWRTQLVPQQQVETVRITKFRRIGRTVRLLEIDTEDDRLLVFSRWDLGTDALEVLDVLTAAGYPADDSR